jgi:hypothetical protein
MSTNFKKDLDFLERGVTIKASKQLEFERTKDR